MITPIPASRVATYATRLSFAIPLLTFVFCLGGIHPSVSLRNVVVAFASGLVLGLNVPAMGLGLRALFQRRWRNAFGAFGLASASFTAAFFVFRFVLSISHESV